MKITFLYCIVTVLLASCSPYILVTNGTNSSIEIVAVLNRDEQANFNLTYSDIAGKNLLNENFKSNETLRIKKKEHLSLVAISNESEYYLINDIKGKKLFIDKSNYNSRDVLVPVGATPQIIELKIENQSKYTITKVKLEMGGYNRKVEIDNAMNFWNLIFPSRKGEIKYECYVRPPCTLKTVVIIAELKGEVIEKEYNENLNDLIVFK